MTKKDKMAIAVEALEKRYPDAKCSLTAENPLQLLIATRLSAQCTDARVNLVTPALFERFKTCDDFASAQESEVAEYIRSCGLYKTKAHDIVEMCRQIRDNFGGEVPDSIEKLTSLSGIGRKTANLIMGDVYRQPAVVTDTHLIRITNRLGLSQGKEPYKVEMQIRKIIAPEKSSDFCHRIVQFGRDVCKAQSPKCDECELKSICSQKFDKKAEKTKK